MTRVKSSGRTRRLPPRDPKGGRPRQDVAARLGTHILDVALEQFVAHGVEGASMEGIAAAANVSKRTLYARFGAKARLLVSAVEHGIAHHLRPIASNIPAGSARDKLLHVGRKILDSSLKREVIGLESLVNCVADHESEVGQAKPSMGAKAGIAIIQSILEEACGTRARESDTDLPFLAAFLFDALVTSPRHRILQRRELENTAQAKSDYLERTMELIADGMPFLGRCSPD
ncbi:MULTISPECIES: TetR/AcrR family transcriptional regulator [Sphingomonadaceae]|uniref:TetR/AcrR family transcriptional regulator n=1 Tax=Sphingomonadales TaxID=204457 RepID=UPI0009EB9279|nr:TetR/AcrR family transcriptional regulator [Sphingobium sp. TKS]MCF8706743.1 TetR/AcrR family transcriptional regulator [Rhizorhapis sp. SPR117]